MKYVAPPGQPDPNADYITGIPGIKRGSPIPGEMPTHVQREIVNAILAADLVPDGEQLDQLALAIGIIAQRMVPPPAPERLGFLLPAGSPVMGAGNNLYPNCVWPDGSLVLFADWPDLQAQYAGGYIHTLPKGSTATQIANNPGSWVLADDGLYLPTFAGLFPRWWRPNQTADSGRTCGSLQGDAIRNITGTASLGSITGFMSYNAKLTGAFTAASDESLTTGPATQANTQVRMLSLNAGLVVPTADEARPINYAQSIQIYLGRYKTEVQ